MSAWPDDSNWGGGATTTAVVDDWNAVKAPEASADFDSDNVGGGFDGNNENVNPGGDDRACYNCGETGHNKADCPKPRAPPTGPCRRCNEEGHWSKECPNAPPMVCFDCGSAEHLSKECPDRSCKNCGEKGHSSTDCKSARLVDRSAFPDMSTEDAWELIKKAVNERDIDDVKEAVQVYVKSSPSTTYPELEEAFRSQKLPLWLIAIEKTGLASTLTNMDLQGELEKKYTVTYRFQWNPPRPRDREVWPKDVEENIERLKDAGEVVPRGVPKCRNCDQIGHTSKSCPEEKLEKEAPTIKCYNCDTVGHRIRDCPIPRVDKFACKNCGQSGHKVADCTEPRSADNVECRKCNETGHFAKDCPTGGGFTCRNCNKEGHGSRDCPEPRNPASIQCRNCDEFGHMSKECPKPRDITRVKCSNCQQMGHFKSRCTNPLVDEDAGNNGDANGDTHGGGFGDSGGNTNGGDDFGSAPAADYGAMAW